MTEVTLDPRNPAHIETLSLRSDGTLLSSDPRFQRELDDAQETAHKGALPPHCGVVRLYLRKRFRGQP